MKSKPTFFTNQTDFSRWLEANHQTETELLVGFYKVNSGKPSMTWPESVDQALCFGWIDGIRRSIDVESYSVRFTPRNPKSNWSAVNIKKVAELTKKGLMQPAGRAAFEKRDEERSRIYSYEKRAAKFPDAFEKQFKEDKSSWEFFQNQPPGYKKTCINWVMSAKRPATRQRRIEKLISVSGKHLRIF